MKGKIPSLLLAPAVLAALAACTGGRGARPNVLLVVVDALRADRLGCYGSPLGLTPFLDSLAASSTVFHRAYTASPWTKGSIASLQTSRYQSQHGVISLRSVLPEEESTLAEELLARGYATAGVSANILMNRAGGYAQGYQRYEAFPPEGTGETLLQRTLRARDVNRHGLEWLAGPAAEGGKPFFLYLHYMETHTPYDPPTSILAARFAGREPPDLDRLNRHALTGQLTGLDDALLADLIAVYEAEVVAVDRELGSLFEELERRGLLGHTLVVVTADHGEGFMEHGFLGHGNALYEEMVRVPLIVKLPGQRRHADVEEPVSLVDIAPTVLDSISEPAAPTFEGRSLKRLLPAGRTSWLESLGGRDAAPSDEGGAVFLEFLTDKERDPNLISLHERAVVEGRRKLIAGVGGGREAYDLDSDPGERRPGDLDPEARRRLEEALDAFRRRAAERSSPRRSRTLDPETIEHMRALGYAE